jgi:hypothetical protein
MLGGPAGAAGPGLPDSGTLVLPPEEDRELCRPLAAGQALHYDFTSSLDLTFAAHWHHDSDARTLWRKDELHHEAGDLPAVMAATYCLYWHNYQDRALTLRWTVGPHR